jgi:uncharacterized protein YicC (UPF0701 family)
LECGIDPRLAQEVVFFTEHSDVTEEMTRLHPSREFKRLLHVHEPVGRKLDFLLQVNHELIQLAQRWDSDVTVSSISERA